jgi:hypothetical protein
MDLLKKEEGFSIIESLVGIIILGLIVIFFSLFFNKIFQTPKILLRGEAFYLANQEIENSLNMKSKSDTVYSNLNRNLQIRRMVRKEEKLYNIQVEVFTTLEKKCILNLSAYYK